MVRQFAEQAVSNRRALRRDDEFVQRDANKAALVKFIQSLKR